MQDKSISRAVKKVVAFVAVSVVLAGTLTGCSNDTFQQKIDRFGYAVGSPLVTTNGASFEGVANNADILAERLFPPVFVTGPAGQLIPNRDLATAQYLPGQLPRVTYTINENAKFSNGAPVTCTDFLLTYAASTMPALFNAHIPLMEQVKEVECANDEKQFTVIFKEGMGSRWRHLFSSGSVMSAQAIATKAGMTTQELAQAIAYENPTTLKPVADVWNNGFSLKNFDPELNVSFGPYKVGEVAEDGSVTLVPNEFFAGDVANIKEVVVYPQGTDLAALAGEKQLNVADLVGVKDIPWVNREDPKNYLNVTQSAGQLVEQLSLGDAGVFATKEARQQFGHCVNRESVAKVSSEHSGVEVPPVANRLTTHTESANEYLKDVANQHMTTNFGEAAKLNGATVRIGYRGPDARMAAIVEDIRLSCATVGINVVDASAEAGTLGDVTRTTKTEWGIPTIHEGALDAVLYAVDPGIEFGSIDGSHDDLVKLKDAELKLWDEVPTIPLAAQPRTQVVDKRMTNVVANTALSGIGWNMERWQEGD